MSFFDKLYAVDRMLIREICDWLNMYDIATFAKTCVTIRKFTKSQYDFGVIHLLYKDVIWEECLERYFNKGIDGFSHKAIREWNPTFGQAYVYAWLLKDYYPRMAVFGNLSKKRRIMY